MKIFYLASVRIPSEKASGLAIARQCEAFVEIGHTVELFVPRRSNEEKALINDVYGFDPKFKVKYFKANSIYSLGKLGFFLMLMRDAIKLLISYLKTEIKPDIIYSRDHRLLFLFILFGLKEKCFIEMHTKHDDFITKYVLKRAKKVIVISQGLADFYSELIDRADIQVEPSGVYLKQFENLPDSNVSKQKLSLPINKKIFAYIGKYKTMGEEKGVDEIIVSFAKIVSKYPEAFLYLVGIEDSEVEQVSQLSKENGLELGKNMMIEKLDQSMFAQYLNASDVLLMNYPNTEHYAKYMSPTKLFAYMAVGKPIISSSLESIKSILNNDSIMFSEAKNTALFLEAMEKSLEEYELLKYKAGKNLEIVNKYSWNQRGLRICS